MTDKCKRCGTCARWGYHHSVNRKRICKADYTTENEYGPRHPCHRPDDYEQVSTDDLSAR